MKNSFGAIAVLIIILIAVVIYLNSQGEKVGEPGNAAVETNSTEISVPDVNPVSQTNPFSDIKTNPFE